MGSKPMQMRDAIVDLRQLMSNEIKTELNRALEEEDFKVLQGAVRNVQLNRLMDSKWQPFEDDIENQIEEKFLRMCHGGCKVKLDAFIENGLFIFVSTVSLVYAHHYLQVFGGLDLQNITRQIQTEVLARKKKTTKTF